MIWETTEPDQRGKERFKISPWHKGSVSTAAGLPVTGGLGPKRPDPDSGRHSLQISEKLLNLQDNKENLTCAVTQSLPGLVCFPEPLDTVSCIPSSGPFPQQ